MRRLDFAQGLRWGIYLGGIQILLAVSSYVTACVSYRYDQCDLSHGWKWIMHHPVFPSMIPAVGLFGFFVGAFLGLFPVISNWLKVITSLIFIGALVIGLVVWGTTWLPFSS